MARQISLVAGEVATDIDTWIEATNVDIVRAWISTETQPIDIVRTWYTLREARLPLTAALITEQRIAELGAEIGPYFRSAGSSYAEEVVESRWVVARSLRRHAASIPFGEQIVLSRASDLTRRYFDSLRPFAKDQDPERSTARIEREIARQTVMAARFGSADVAHLEAAVRYLKDAAASDTDHLAAALFLESAIELYHATDDVAPLVEAATFGNRRMVPADDWPTWHIGLAEVWLNICEHASEKARTRFLEYASMSLQRAEQQACDATQEVRAAMLRGIISFFGDTRTSQVASLKGVRLPFLLRTAKELPSLVVDASAYLTDALESAANRGQYQYREYLAALRSRLARLNDARTRENLLHESIRLRDPVGTKRALSGVRDRLAQAQDLLLLGRLRSDENIRAQGIDVLLTIHLEPTTSSSEPLVLLANELETAGPAKSRSVVASADLMNAIYAGDFRRVFAMAATAAFNDQSLRISGLGGRGNAFTVEDFSGFTGQTFVFKPSTAQAADRDASRATALRQHILNRRLDGDFGVIEHLDELNVNSTVVSVRRFARGRTLRQAVHEATASDRISLIRRTARLLGEIHAFEAKSDESTNSSRKVLKEREVGRWIRRVAGPQYLSLFDRWWNLYNGLQNLPRRDAHTLNWLVAEDGRILAVDLEAQGKRPITYELAQLLEDDPLFPAEDTVVRQTMLEEYAAALGIPPLSLRNAFEASIAARAVGLLSDPRSSETKRNHGYELLDRFSSAASSQALRVWTSELLGAWKLRTGLADPSRYRAIQPNDRVRISKAMSYHLRHDASAPTARGGWMYADDLATVMRAHGHRVTAEQLLVVAGALGEPRFELDGTEIRAAYGHSLDRRNDFEVASPPTLLYHATPSRNLQHIVEGRAGLEAGGRQFVHLTPDPERAVRSAGRHGRDALLLKIDAANVDGLVKATEDTWLAPKVNVEQLAIVPVHEVGPSR